MSASASAAGGLRRETATFGAGCFWGVEWAFGQIGGVLATRSGYAGGTVPDPTYEQVCDDTTGHAEVVEVVFDGARVSYDQLLAAFWEMHDPTQRNRQGPDEGSQYRSVIFTHAPEQEAAAKKAKADLTSSGHFKRPVVTQILPAPTFYVAEEYHQKYAEKNGGAGCHI